jgi:type III secretory pathway component EscR
LGRGANAEMVSGQSLEALGIAADKAKEPLREFLLKHASARDRSLFHAMALRMRTPRRAIGITDRDFLVLVPAFLASELRRAFEIGFLLFIPFLVVDMVISNLLLALACTCSRQRRSRCRSSCCFSCSRMAGSFCLRGLVESYV